MKYHKIDFMNANQLSDELSKIRTNSKKSSGRESSVGGDNLKFVHDLILRRSRGEITMSQRNKILFNHGIDKDNAIEFYNAHRLKGSPDENTYDIYEMLLEYIKRNPHCDYYIDELPILINRKSLKYDRNAVRRFVKILDECQKALHPGHTIWVAMQTNGLMDVGAGYPKKWSEYIKEAEQSLEASNFRNEHLEINFRNSNEVFKCSNGIEQGKASNTNIQNVLGLPTTGTTVSSSVPKMLNFTWKNKETGNQDDLNQVVGRAIQDLSQDKSDSEHDSYVVLVDDVYFELDQVAKALKHNKEMDIKIYPCNNKSNVREELDEFLDNPVGCLIAPKKL